MSCLQIKFKPLVKYKYIYLLKETFLAVLHVKELMYYKPNAPDLLSERKQYGTYGVVVNETVNQQRQSSTNCSKNKLL